mmetsp:Transcript_16446/g.50068  ORF Transcript_16446/g.50068 Transcript_16446/m.50068 type:complete len:95 (-) Transcript_16446:1458-1742(-)|eukprot:scaffold50805_cov31-Tisochrysis_lutea.AAC.5
MGSPLSTTVAPAAGSHCSKHIKVTRFVVAGGVEKDVCVDVHAEALVTEGGSRSVAEDPRTVGGAGDDGVTSTTVGNGAGGGIGSSDIVVVSTHH